MKPLRIGFLVPHYNPPCDSHMPVAIRTLREWGVVADIIPLSSEAIDLSTVRVEYDLYVLKRMRGLAVSIAGALHVQGAAIVNPYPVTVALNDKIVTSSILQTAGVPTPNTYVVSKPALLAPLLDDGPLVVKPYQGSGGFDVRVVRSMADLEAVAAGREKEQIFAQRYHAAQGPDRKMYLIGDRIFGVEKTFPRHTEAEKHGTPFTPTPEQCELVLRCARAFGINLCGVDIIESAGKQYVIDMCSMPGFKGVLDAPSLLASYLKTAAERAARGDPLLDSAVSSARLRPAASSTTARS